MVTSRFFELLFEQTDDEFYNIYLMLGQSNMVGYDSNTSYLPTGDTDLATANANVRYLFETSRTNDAEKESTDVYIDLQKRSSEDANEFGAELSLGKHLYSTYSIKKPVIVKVAAGSSGLYQHATDRDWNVATTGSKSLLELTKTKLNQAIAQCPAGIVPRIRALIWNQGERECNAAASSLDDANNYKANLQALIANIRSTYARYIDDMRVVITSSLLQDPIATTGDNLNRQNIVRLAQQQVANEDSNGIFVTTDVFRLSGRYDADTWNSAIVGNGNSHYLTPEYVKLGNIYAYACVQNKQQYRYQFINNQGGTIDIAVTSMVGVRKGGWTCRRQDGTAITNLTNVSPGYFTVARQSDIRPMYDQPQTIGTLNLGYSPGTATSYAFIFKDSITTLNKNNANNPILCGKIDKISIQHGGANTNCAIRLVLKVNGNYIIQNKVWGITKSDNTTTTGYAMTQGVTSGADFDTKADVCELAFSRTASDWKQFTDNAGGTYADGDAFYNNPANFPAVANDLGVNDAIEEIGFYVYSATTPGAGTQLISRMNGIKIIVNK